MVAAFTNINPKLYLSSFQIVVPEMTNQDVKKRIHDPIQYLADPIHWLYADRQDAWGAKVSYDQTFPIYIGRNSDLAEECAKRLSSQLKWGDVDILCYCHETIESSYSMIPALRLKKQMGMKDSLPYSVGAQGSLAPLSAIETAYAFMVAEQMSTALVISADSIKHPFSRIAPGGYVKGDAATAFILSSANGDYGILHWEITCDCLAVSYDQWGQEEYFQAEGNLTRHLKKLAVNWMECFAVDCVIAQHLSTSFLEEVETLCLDRKLRLWSRPHCQKVNLLGSDPFYSLFMAEQAGHIVSGERILLLFASIDHGIGCLIIQKN